MRPYSTEYGRIRIAAAEARAKELARAGRVDNRTPHERRCDLITELAAVGLVLIVVGLAWLGRVLL